ncbi:MAG: Cys-tRNA(Pro) deacylase [Selenomonadaceae bacterium]|nr:Cys-tRNA(Pro) deacylase [Selenomonadaceae bacterium]MBQ6759325.1 Cys-tRNA(Pro) deacylase [Selenomonadaceae bacterium]MBR0102731.1 Cys-tRNA(Pro) deacylase [Selenomonadaceae bacterium]
MTKKIKKTNAARILDGLGIAYEIKTYDVDESDLSAVHVAEVSGLDIKMIFKTLVARGDKSGVIMAVIGGGEELDLKSLAKASGNKSVEMIALKELLPLTGYVRGGCSPLGAKKNYPVYLDARAMTLERISISAGQRGMQLVLAPQDLVRAVGATVAELVQ